MSAGVLVHYYAPRGAARDLLHCRKPEVLIAGPAGTGKSMACLQKMHLAALGTERMRGLVVRKTLVSLTTTGLVTYRQHVAQVSLKAGHVKWFGGSRQEPAAYRYSNGSTIVVGGMDDPDKIMSSEYDIAYAQEATDLNLDEWEKITTRLRSGILSFQQLIADCNPNHPQHWLRKRCDSGLTLELLSKHEDNPVYFNEDGTMTEQGREYMAKLDRLTGVRYLRLRKGIWAAAEGVVYEDYDPSVHLIEPFKIPDSWTRWWTVDFGFTNPFVLQCWAEDHDGRLFLYREIYHSKRLVEDHARTILRAVTELLPDAVEREDGDVLKEVNEGRRVWTEPRPRGVICDHDAEDRATLERHLGMSTSAAHKTVSDGIQATQARFKNAADGKPRIFFVRDCLLERDAELVSAVKPTCTVEEIPGYIWPPGTPRTKDKPPAEAPIKKDDHGCDGTRYMVAERDLDGRFNVRWL